MKSILFLIHDLGQGGAEKVLVNLVNNMDRTKFNITVMALFGGGVNEQFLKSDIRYITVFSKVFPGNSHLMKVFSPHTLHKMFIKEKYDIEVSYLEGPCARIISGCPNKETKLVSWIHVEQHSMKNLAASFKNSDEAQECYNRFHRTVCVSKYVQEDFCSILDYQNQVSVLYNTVESDVIRTKALESQKEIVFEGKVRIIAVGTLKESKGYERLLRIIKRLKIEGHAIHLYILGIGPLENTLKEYIVNNDLDGTVSMLGYRTNPYKYVKNSDLFVCASFAEGFSTAVTESLIIGTPVCTVDVSGMKELLGDNNEYGIVTSNSEDDLYTGIKRLLIDSCLLQYYKEKSLERGKMFSTQKTVQAVEEMLDKLTI